MESSGTRLASALWVSALLRRIGSAGGLGAVLRRGDAQAGTIVLLLRRRDGLLPMIAARDGSGRPVWRRSGSAEVLTDSEANAWVERQVKTDPDLWAVEVEDPDGRWEGSLPPR